ncbi:MAG: helix-turn-helix domain-containing protein, partial [Kiritimatiellae bacterium]|nr:helix-turn-helix domain-containing protein [Kiritimatiellia bacterium]
TGLPPHHFLLTCRIEEAKRRLSVKGLSITRIAQDLGFCSSQHFSSHFKRATGLKPLAWRKQ